MVDEHYIEFIELVTETEVLRRYLAPGQNHGKFKTGLQESTAREYCNLHGLWVRINYKRSLYGIFKRKRNRKNY